MLRESLSPMPKYNLTIRFGTLNDRSILIDKKAVRECNHVNHPWSQIIYLLRHSRSSIEYEHHLHTACNLQGSCCSVNPRDYLNDIIARIPYMKDSTTERLL